MSSHLNAAEGEGGEVTKVRSTRTERTERSDMEISYPTLPPMWPAFEEHEFHPKLQFQKKGSSVRRRSITHSATHAGLSINEELQRDATQFSVSPGLPGQISLDETTGIIKGCPLMERAAGCTYTISAADKNGEILAKCQIRFAVAPAEVASLCNAAFLGQEVKPKPHLAKTSKAAEGSPSAWKRSTSPPQSEIVSEVLPRQGWAARGTRAQPPLHGLTAQPSPVRPWMTVQQALNASLTKHSSRQGVIPLGPPLKDRLPALPPVKLDRLSRTPWDERDERVTASSAR